MSNIETITVGGTTYELPSGAQIDDTTTSSSKLWSSDKTNTELSGKANSSDLSTLSGTVSSNNTTQNNKHKVSRKWVNRSDWAQDTTSQSGTTLYKKSLSVNHVYVASPIVDIANATNSVLPSTAHQNDYNLVQYVTVDDTVPCLYFYASAIPTTGFWVNITGVD